MTTKRSMLRFVLLSLVTCGVYGVIQLCILSVDINDIARPHDGRITMFYLLACLIGIPTMGVFLIIWLAMLTGRIQTELRRRGLSETLKVCHFWLWGILGSFCLVGPFIYMYKMCKAMNQLSADYNAKG